MCWCTYNTSRTGTSTPDRQKGGKSSSSSGYGRLTQTWVCRRPQQGVLKSAFLKLFVVKNIGKGLIVLNLYIKKLNNFNKHTFDNRPYNKIACSLRWEITHSIIFNLNYTIIIYILGDFLRDQNWKNNMSNKLFLIYIYIA